MRAAIHMDGQPPRTRTMHYDNSSTTSYRDTPEFMRGLERQGVRGRVADAYLKGISVQTEFGTGETIVINAKTDYSVTRTGNR